MNPSLALAGLLVGFLIGLTGIGGGAVLVPLLTAMGIPPAVVVGSAPGFALITRLAGIGIHAGQGSVDWRWVRLMAIGSMPGALIGSFVLSSLIDSPGAIRYGVGVMLLFTASLVPLMDLARRRQWRLVDRLQQPKPWVVALLGLLMGVVVGTTSIGSGSLTEVLLMLFSALAGAQLVGTALAHSILLSGVAALSHWGLGNVDGRLVLNLLVGSIPGVIVGSRLAYHTPPRTLKLGIATVVFVSAFSML
jgi:uncharacterized membrane protein YfcA